MGEVVKLPIDMNCLNAKLLTRIAELTPVDELDTVRDRKDKLVSRLYMKKLELLLEDEINILHRCVYCHNLFTERQREFVVCPKAQIFIDFHGSVIAQHIADHMWDVNKFVTWLRNSKNLSWKEI